MEPRQLSQELRLGEGDDLARRRWIVGLSVLGSAIGGVVGLYQTGIIRRLPDPPSDLFDSERVDASDYAYSRLNMPDAFLMMGTYAVTGALAGAGGKDRARDQPWLPIALAMKTAYDVYVNLKLAREEWQENGALCAYCQTATLASIASAALAVPEAARAVEHLIEDEAGQGWAAVIRDRPERALPPG